MGEAAADECDFPASATAEVCGGLTLAVVLE